MLSVCPLVKLLFRSALITRQEQFGFVCVCVCLIYLFHFSLPRYVPPIDPALANRGLIRPLDIAIGFDNFEILKIDDRDFTVEINAYLVVKWRDTRVHINFEQVSYNSDSHSDNCSSNSNDNGNSKSNNTGNDNSNNDKIMTTAAATHLRAFLRLPAVPGRVAPRPWLPGGPWPSAHPGLDPSGAGGCH